MAFVYRTTAYIWKERLIFGKPSFKPYRLTLYANGKILWEKENGSKHKGSANLMEIFPRIRIGALNSEAKKERAADEGLILAYHTLILPLESFLKPTGDGWQEREFAMGFEREIREWMQAFARVVRRAELLEEVEKKYHERRRCKAFGSHYGLIGAASESEDDPARLWSAAHGADDDYVLIWSSFQEQANVQPTTKNGEDGRGASLLKCWQG